MGIGDCDLAKSPIPIYYTNIYNLFSFNIKYMNYNKKYLIKKMFNMSGGYESEQGPKCDIPLTPEHAGPSLYG